jgi:RNA polymerase sigma-70 factor (ECF subfamily)
MTTDSPRPDTTAELPSAAAAPSLPTAPSDATLVERAKGGDRAACEALLDRWFDRVAALARARLRNPEAAEDLTQEVFLRAWLKLDDLRDGDRFGPWVMRMTQNLSLMWRRSGARRSKLVQMVPWEDDMSAASIDPTLSAPLAISHREQTDALRAALAKLDDDERELIRLHYENELSQRETARALGVHHTTIGRRLGGVLDKLRASIAEVEGTDPGEALRCESRRIARARASAVVAGLGALTTGAREGVAAAAASSAPGIASVAGAQIGLVVVHGAGFLKTTTSSLSAGISIMTTVQKTIATIAAVGAIAASVWVATSSRPPAAAPRPISQQLTAVSFDPASATATTPLAMGAETVVTVPFGQTVAFDIPGPNSAQLSRVVAYADAAGFLEAQLTTDSGGVEFRRLYPSSTDPSADTIWTSIQIWPERNLFLVESLFLEQTPEGMRLTMWRQNKPQFLRLSEGVQKQLEQGMLTPEEASDKLWVLLVEEGFLPPAGGNRTLLTHLFDREWR